MLTFADGLALHQAMVTELAENHASTNGKWIFKVNENFNAYFETRGVKARLHCGGLGEDWAGNAGGVSLEPGDLAAVLTEAAAAIKAKLQAEAAAITSAADAL